jgi:cyclic-di-GMP-binding protein
MLKIVAATKGAKRKVDDDRLHVADTKKDDLQHAITLLRKTELGVSPQFDIFRD